MNIFTYMIIIFASVVVYGQEDETTVKPTTTTTTTIPFPKCAPVPKECFNAIRLKGLQVTNSLRAKHESPELSLMNSTNIYGNNLPKDWACHLIETLSFRHNNLRDKKYGENIFIFFNNKPFVLSASNCENLIEIAVKKWYSEIAFYDFNLNKPNGRGPWGHFTQLIWFATSEVSFGIAHSDIPDSEGFYKCMIVANYLPAGNKISLFADHVLPLGGRKVEPEKNE